MTTIAYKNGIIAYDSQLTAGQVITDFDYDKQIIKDDHRFFMCGPTWLYPKFIDSFFACKNLIKLIDENIEPDLGAMIVKNDNTLFISGIDDDDVFWTCEASLFTHTAMGTGSSFALTAMDMGASAEEAVAMAAKRDIFTGGIIKTYRLLNYKGVK